MIRDGATLVQNVDDVSWKHSGRCETPWKTREGNQVHRPSELKLNEIERKVLDAIQVSSTSMDQVIQASELPTHQVIAIVSVLEMKRLVQRTGGSECLPTMNMVSGLSKERAGDTCRTFRIDGF